MNPLTLLSAPGTAPSHRSRPALPATPPSDQFQAAEHDSDGSWGLAKVALTMIVGGAALTGCTQAPPVQPIQASTPLPVENPQLMVLPDGVPRIDIYRSTTTTTSTDMNGNMTTSESDDAYQPVGTYMGAGIFHDLNDNLVFVPQLAFGEKVGLTDFQHVTLGRESKSNWFQAPTLSHAPGSKVTTATRMNIAEISSDDGSVTLSNGSRTRSQSVRTPAGVEIKDWGRSRYEIRQNGNAIDVFSYGRKTTSLTRQDGVIHLQRYNNRPYVITQDGPRITVERGGWSSPEVITKTADGFQVEQGSRHYQLSYGESEIHSDSRSYTPIQHR